MTTLFRSYLKFNRLALFFFLIVVTAFFSSCTEDNLPSIDKDTIALNNFIYDNMGALYLWNNYIPAINPEEMPNSKDLFYDLLYKKIDKWSFITDDYQGLMNYFSGIQLSNGMNFQLYPYGQSNVIGVVEYVDKDSPANRAGILRGDVFYKVNGVALDTLNFYDLLTQDNYTLTFGSLTNSGIIELSPTVNLVAEELTVDPIHYSDIIDVNGENVGYLVLTAFQKNNEQELTDLFGEFKSHNVSDLILDLRYNPGGTISTSELLASLIGPSSIANNVMIKKSYNSDVEAYLKQAYPDDESYFVERFPQTDNNLNLSRLFVLTTEGTASASEMVIYCLQPYMEVIQIGNQTRGKYYGSTTIQYDKNPNWAIQPIIMRAENSDNSINYEAGLPPDYVIKDDYWHQLGDPQEILLAKAINLISGTSGTTSAELKSAYPKLNTSPLKNSKYKLRQKSFNMYCDIEGLSSIKK